MYGKLQYPHNDLSNKVFVPNKPDKLNLSVFNMIIGLNQSKILTIHTSCKCKCKIDGIKCNSNQKWNNDRCQCESKNLKKHAYKKSYIWNPNICSSENDEYLGSSTGNSVITFDEIINAADSVSVSGSVNVTSTVSTNFNKKVRYKMDCYILHIVVLVIIVFAVICSHYAIHSWNWKKRIAVPTI